MLMGSHIACLHPARILPAHSPGASALNMGKGSLMARSVCLFLVLHNQGLNISKG